MACLIVTEHAQSHAYDYAAFGRLIVPTMLLEIRSDACVRLRPTAVRTYAVVVELLDCYGTRSIACVRLRRLWAANRTYDVA